jgi:hypothetical protein
MIKRLQQSCVEVISMSRIGIIFGLIVFFAGVTYAERTETGLIRVEPRFKEASYRPDARAKGAATRYGRPHFRVEDPPPPAPKDQLYVFWLLGKVISYPVDKVESLIFRSDKIKGDHVPGPVIVNTNPFKKLNESEIPPAPPVVGQAKRNEPGK